MICEPDVDAKTDYTAALGQMPAEKDNCPRSRQPTETKNGYGKRNCPLPMQHGDTTSTFGRDGRQPPSNPPTTTYA